MEARSPSSAPAAATTTTPGAAVAAAAAMTAGELSAPGFVSLGMVVLDEIRFLDGRVLRDVAGGSGFYSALTFALLCRSVTYTWLWYIQGKGECSVVVACFGLM